MLAFAMPTHQQKKLQEQPLSVQQSRPRPQQAGLSFVKTGLCIYSEAWAKQQLSKRCWWDETVILRHTARERAEDFVWVESICEQIKLVQGGCLLYGSSEHLQASW